MGDLLGDCRFHRVDGIGKRRAVLGRRRIGMAGASTTKMRPREVRCANVDGPRSAGDIDVRHRDGSRLDATRAARRVLRQGRRLRFWQRSRDCSVPVRRCGPRPSMAERTSIRRRRGRCHDHAGARRHHCGLYRLPDRRSVWSRGRRSRYLFAVLSVYDSSRTLFQEIR